MRKTLTVTVLVLVPLLTARGQEKKEQPAKGPVTAKLVAKKTTYKLDLGGNTADEFKKSIQAAEKAGDPLPSGPAVEMALELTNTSDKEVKVWIGGDGAALRLELKGPGAISAAYLGPVDTGFRLPATVTLAPGKTQTIPIASLSFGHRDSSRAYWTEVGEYTLTASYGTAINPAPPGGKDAGQGFGRVALTAAPIKLKVEAK
jgi:hypothetical protein